MTKAGDQVHCFCGEVFRATKHRKKYCGPVCADDARKVRGREAKRRQRGSLPWDEYLAANGKVSRK